VIPKPSVFWSMRSSGEPVGLPLLKKNSTRFFVNAMI